MKLIYDVADKPKLSKTFVFAFQQMIAIMAATLLVPMLVSGYGLEADVAAALFGAGIGTIVYLLFTKRRSPVFLGSSFTFLGAYSASIGQNYGYWGMIIGVTFAGLVYVVIALFVRLIGSGWVNKLMPPVIIGPIVALIGLSLSGTATSWIMGNGAAEIVYTETYNWVSIVCALFTFFMIVIASVKGSKRVKLIPFIIGIGAGYALALVFTLIGLAAGRLDRPAFGHGAFRRGRLRPRAHLGHGTAHGGARLRPENAREKTGAPARLLLNPDENFDVLYALWESERKFRVLNSPLAGDFDHPGA